MKLILQHDCIFFINRKQKLKATNSFIESMEKDLDENDELKDEDR